MLKGQGVPILYLALGAAVVIATAGVARSPAPAWVQRGIAREVATPVPTLNSEILEEISAARTAPGHDLRKLPRGSEAAAFLRQQMPIPPLVFSRQLATAAARHLAARARAAR